MLVTEVRSGDAPKSLFPIKTNKKVKHPEIRIGGRRQRRQPVNHLICFKNKWLQSDAPVHQLVDQVLGPVDRSALVCRRPAPTAQEAGLGQLTNPP